MEKYSNKYKLAAILVLFEMLRCVGDSQCSAADEEEEQEDEDGIFVESGS